jgi:hypothetical protein
MNNDDLSKRLGDELCELPFSEYIDLIETLADRRFDIDSLGKNLFIYPFERARTASTAQWDRLYSNLRRLWAVNPNVKFFTVRFVARLLIHELNPASWDDRIESLKPALLHSLLFKDDPFSDGIAPFASQLWWVTPLTSALTCLLKEFDQTPNKRMGQVGSIKARVDALSFQTLLARADSPPFRMEDYKKDPFGYFLQHFRVKVEERNPNEIRVLLNDLHVTMADQFGGHNKVEDIIQARFIEYVETLLSALVFKDLGIAHSIFHWVWKMNSWHGRSMEKLACLAGRMRTFLQIDPRFVFSILESVEDFPHESPELIVELQKLQSDASVPQNTRDYVEACYLLYVYWISPQAREWSKETSNELLAAFHAPSQIIRSSAAFLVGHFYSKTMSQEPALTQIVERIRTLEPVTPGIAGPFIEGIKKGHEMFLAITGTTLREFTEELLVTVRKSQKALETNLDLLYFWTEIKLPTLAAAIETCPVTSRHSNVSFDIRMDPTRLYVGQKDFGSAPFSADAAEQEAISRRLLNEHFEGMQATCVERLRSDDPARVWASLSFVDPRQAGQIRRTLYTVRFVIPRSGPNVKLVWQELLELYDPRHQATYHVELPYPPSVFSDLMAVKAMITCEEGIHGKVGEIIELERPLEGQSRAWGQEYVLNRELSSSVKYLEFKLGNVWHEAYPGQLLITWEQFLKAYGLKQKDDWVNDFPEGYEAKRKFVLSAIKAKGDIPFGLLDMVGIGHLEDILGAEVLEDLEAFEKETQDVQLRDRLYMVISSIWVSGEPEEIQNRWMTLVKKMEPS